MHIEGSEKNQESGTSSLSTGFEGGLVKRARSLADDFAQGKITSTKLLEDVHNAQHKAAQEAGHILMQAATLAVQEVFEKNPHPTKDDIHAAVLNTMQDVIRGHFSSIRTTREPTPKTE